MMLNLLQSVSLVYVLTTATICFTSHLEAIWIVSNVCSTRSLVWSFSRNFVISTTELRRKLHGLPIRHRVDFKLCSFTFRNSEPSALARRAIWPVTFTTVNRRGRCAPATLSCYTGQTLHRTFTDIHSQSWLQPSETTCVLSIIRDCVSLDTLKTAFKTRLFDCAYSPRR